MIAAVILQTSTVGFPSCSLMLPSGRCNQGVIALINQVYRNYHHNSVTKQLFLFYKLQRCEGNLIGHFHQFNQSHIQSQPHH